MTAPPTPTAERPAGRWSTVGRHRLWRYAVAALVVVALVVIIGPRGRSATPLDPESTSPLGTRGILEVLGRLGTEVEVGTALPGPAEGVTLVIEDTLTDTQRRGLDRWVAQGGRVVLADPFSDLAPDLIGLTSIAFTEPTIQPRCDQPWVAGVSRVAVSGGMVFDRPERAVGCFPRNGGFWLVRTPQGDGEIITMGGPLTLTNESLAVEDTAVLLVNLLTPGEGGRLVVITGGTEEPADRTLADLLPDQVRYALAQIPLAWLALVWWRGRRHGAPVVETPPVRIEAAETTVAIGNLLHTAGRAEDAAAIIRARVHRELARRLGLPAIDDASAFVAVAARRTDVDQETLRRLLAGPLPTDDAGLVDFADTAARTIAGTRHHRRPPEE